MLLNVLVKTVVVFVTVGHYKVIEIFCAVSKG